MIEPNRARRTVHPSPPRLVRPSPALGFWPRLKRITQRPSSSTPYRHHPAPPAAGLGFFDRHEPNVAASAGQAERGNHVDYPRMREGGLRRPLLLHLHGGLDHRPSRGEAPLSPADRRGEAPRRDRPAMVLATTTAAEVRAALTRPEDRGPHGHGGRTHDRRKPARASRLRAAGRPLPDPHHSLNTTWGDSSGDKPAHNGLTDFGKDVVRGAQPARGHGRCRTWPTRPSRMPLPRGGPSRVALPHAARSPGTCAT